MDQKDEVELPPSVPKELQQEEPPFQQRELTYSEFIKANYPHRSATQSESKRPPYKNTVHPNPYTLDDPSRQAQMSVLSGTGSNTLSKATSAAPNVMTQIPPMHPRNNSSRPFIPEVGKGGPTIANSHLQSNQSQSDIRVDLPLLSAQKYESAHTNHQSKGNTGTRTRLQSDATAEGKPLQNPPGGPFRVADVKEIRDILMTEEERAHFWQQSKVKGRYQSRNNKKYDDEDSLDDGQDFEDANQSTVFNKMDKFKAQRIALEKELEKNQQLMDSELQQRALGANSDKDVKPNQRFKNFNDIFSGLTKSKNVVTMYPIISCIITYDSKHAITVTKRSEREYYIKQYCLETYKLTFEEKIGGGKNQYIKLKEVEQSPKGDYYAVVYMDDGKFRLRTFGKHTRNEEEIEVKELKINEEFGINNHTIPIYNFPDPFITCTFVDDEWIFANFYHQASLTHHHFFFNHRTREIKGKAAIQLDSNKKNFPYKCFFSEEENEVFSFYRQSQAFRIPVKLKDCPKAIAKPDYILEKIYNKDLGQMYLVNGKALIARCSSQILFFKLAIDEFTKEKNWVNYHTIEQRGFIYFIKGNKRIQLTTDQKIYFYLIDPRTFMPILENVMNNFMNCTQMMFGSKVRYCITYKTNQKSFDIYRRKFEHDFRVNVVQENLDGSWGLPIEDMNAFLVSNLNVIKFYDVDTYQEIKGSQLSIELLQSSEREPNEIISMQKSQRDDFLAVISGKNLIMNMQKPNQLFIFKRIRNLNTAEMDKFEQVKRIRIRDMPEFVDISMQFQFKLTKKEKEPTTLIFARQDRIMEFNFETEEIKEICIFEVPLTRQPEFFLMNDNQSVSIIASIDDGIYYNHKTGLYVDLDEEYKISNIKEIIHDHEDRVFYLLANKFEEKLGLFMIRFSEVDPREHQFFMKWKNKLDIADADVAVMRNQQKKYKELVVSYKTIFINTYNVQVIDISQPTLWTQFRHETFQLWESQINGFFLNKNKDFVTINREGINVLSLGSDQKKVVKADNGQDKMIHSLESMNYLKIDTNNFILYEFANERKIISIMQQFTKENSKSGDETQFETIYKICIHEITLRELLLFQSLYVCNTQSDILKLVMDQPKPAVFYKSFLELDGSNMVSILSFDSRSMKVLLADKNKEFFQSDFPIFYKNKIQKSNNKNKFFYRSAIDSALRNNQIMAVSYIIEYIVKYQNTYVSSFLFQKNIPSLLQKGIELHKLFNSNVFSFVFDYDEWPSTHNDDGHYSRPYNDSIFNLRTSYSEVFYEDRFKPISEDLMEEDNRKIYKVNYTINMLPSLSEYVQVDEFGNTEIVNEGVSLLGLCTEGEELEIFESQNIEKLIKFKWDTFAFKIHMFGCIMHLFYIGMMILYINYVYIHNDQANKVLYERLLVIAIIYPACYDWVQLYKTGWDYFKELQNYSDMIYIYGGIANVILQNTASSQDFINKLLMTIILIQQIIKTFFFMRIFETLSYIVTMINTVVYDLRVFLFFYFILIVLFAMVFAVLGVGNANVEGGFQTFINDIALIDAGEMEGDVPDNIPNEEYDHIGLLIGYIISTLRISLGDFDFEASTYLTESENFLFWIVWFMVVIMTCIIFLNFIIAEASASYESVKSRLTAMINKEKASLIAEAEDMVFTQLKTQEMFPKYIIVREIST